MSQTAVTSTPPGPRRGFEAALGLLDRVGEQWAVALLGLLCLGAFIFQGVWEPWEAERAQALQLMRESGTWLSVNVPSPKGTRAIAELPYGWWPSAVLGSKAIALRLPGILSGVAVLMALFLTGRRFFDRFGGWLAALVALCMPLFSFQSGLSLGAGLSMNLLALGALGFITRAGDEDAGKGWLYLAWFGTVGASLCVGLIGLVAPLVVLAATAGSRSPGERGAALWRGLGPVWVPAIALSLIGGAWALAIANGPENSSLAMLLWADPLTAAPVVAKRPSFEMFTRQIGFGLYPLVAVMPLAFADLLWSDDVPDRLRGLGAALAAFFGITFLFPAWSIPYAGYAVFLGAPLVALAVAGYFWRVFRKSDHQPVLVLVTVVLLALLDSNLKHETRGLADALVATTVETFPPELAYWHWARRFSMVLLLVLIVHQGGAYRVLRPFAQSLYPKRARLWNGWFAGLALIGPAIIGAMSRQPSMKRFVMSPSWGSLRIGVRWFLLGAVAYLILYVGMVALYRLRAKRLDGRQMGRLSRFAEALARFGQDVPVWRGALVLALVGWAGFFSVVTASSLTANFSQKGLLGAFSSFQTGEEALFKHRLETRDNTYYARDLPELNRAEFKSKAKEPGRFFALIPRKQLASVNADFRAATDRTLPVLDDRSYRVLLVSNQLKDDEKDLNPIRRALVDELPPGATKVKINFEDQIELVGWQLTPKEPTPGAQLKITLYWRALKKVRSKWKVFVHIDAPGQRIHADHDPVAGLYPSPNWAPGDIIRDEYTLSVKREISAARFTFYAGLFKGSTRMKIKKGPKDKDNRARLGRVQVR